VALGGVSASWTRALPSVDANHFAIDRRCLILDHGSMILPPSSRASQRDQRPFKTAEEFAHERLRELILSGDLAGGTRLHQDELASRLGVSRMPVRQAILRLENEGLVVQRPNRGATVTLLGSEAILELFEMRSVLEGWAFRLAVSQMTAEHQQEVARLIALLDKSQSKIALWVGRHNELHDYLCQCAARPRLTAAARHLRDSVTPYIRLYLSAYARAEMAGFEHQTLLQAIATGNPARSEAVMREHIMSAAKGVVEFVKAQSKTAKVGEMA
jgi:DNA-binding GntR family transcriptional regulator